MTDATTPFELRAEIDLLRRSLGRRDLVPVVHAWRPYALVLFERAGDALPAVADVDVPLSHPGLLPDLTRAASTLDYLLR